MATCQLATSTVHAQITAPVDELNGQELVAQAATNLMKLSPFKASIRQRVDLFGQQLVGSGSYLQAGEGSDKLIRMELKLQLADQIASVQQIRNHRFLWVRRELSSNSILGRVDLRRFHKAIEKSHEDALNPSTSWIAMGGLPQLLTRLERSFEFGPPKQAEIGDVPVWVVHGSWKPDILATLVPSLQSEIRAGKSIGPDSYPEHLPHRVVLVLGGDNRLPLFPYRCEFQKFAVAEAADISASTNFKSSVTIELFEIQRLDNVDPTLFEYEPGEQDVVDHTALYLQQLGIAEGE